MMRLRTVQFACFVVLLSALGAATSRERGDCRDCASLHLLLAQVAAVSGAEAAQPPADLAAQSQELSASARTLTSQSWSMRPPAAQSTALHAVTGSGL